VREGERAEAQQEAVRSPPCARGLEREDAPGLFPLHDKHAVGEPPCAATSHRRVTFARSLRQATRPLSTVTVRTVGFMVCILLHACVWFIPRPPARSARRAAAPPPQLHCSPQKTTNLAPSALEPTVFSVHHTQRDGY
jgi:hypothetical protein